VGLKTSRRATKWLHRNLPQFANFRSVHQASSRLCSCHGSSSCPWLLSSLKNVSISPDSIETTMKFYVGQDAQATAAELHRAIGQATAAETAGNTFGNTGSADKKGLTPI
jgi:hypothetical protein